MPKTTTMCVYTGPTLVHQLANKLRQAGVDVTQEGTEHVYFRTPDVDAVTATVALQDQLRSAFGTDYGLKPVRP